MREAKLIRRDIKRIITTSTKLQSLIHAVAVECLSHAETHGDSTLINELYRGLPISQRTESLKQWVYKYSPVRFTTDGGVGILKKGDNGYVAFNVKGADANPYYNKPETVSKPLTLAYLIEQVTKLEDQVIRAKEGKGKRRIAEGEDADAMIAFARKLKQSVGLPAGQA